MQDILHVEVCQNVNSTLTRGELEELVKAEISNLKEVKLNANLYPENLADHTLKMHVESIMCCSNNSERSHMKTLNVPINIYVYRLSLEAAAMETMQHDTEELSAAFHWVMPSSEFHGLWDNLYYESDIKENLLSFVETTLLFSNRKVNPNIISWNKVVLLHGPPGTGKTSLCQALAQKVSIRMKKQFTSCELLEINSHSLFSKWFSESGKLVMKLFEGIKILLENPKTLVCVLIDEVESLAHARKSSANGTEPSDSIRVVNALLNQLDQIKRYPNVLILTTSNVTEAIDLAFVDRADIKKYIGNPNERAIHKIYVSCFRELMRTDIIETEELKDMTYLKVLGYEEKSETKTSLKILELSHQSVGLSGRTLRKIPFLAHALFLQQHKKCTMPRFLRAMHLTIEKQKEEEFE